MTRVVLDVEVRDLPRLIELAREAQLEAMGEACGTYEPGEAFALAFNNANLVPAAMACLDEWVAEAVS